MVSFATYQGDFWVMCKAAKCLCTFAFAFATSFAFIQTLFVVKRASLCLLRYRSSIVRFQAIELVTMLFVRILRSTVDVSFISLDSSLSFGFNSSVWFADKCAWNSLHNILFSLSFRSVVRNFGDGICCQGLENLIFFCTFSYKNNT